MLKIPKNIWDKVFKNGPDKICGRQPLKNLKEKLKKYALGRPYPFKFFKDCLPQILLCLFLNSWSHMCMRLMLIKLRLVLFNIKKLIKNLEILKCDFYEKVLSFSLNSICIFLILVSYVDSRFTIVF